MAARRGREGAGRGADYKHLCKIYSLKITIYSVYSASGGRIPEPVIIREGAELNDRAERACPEGGSG